MPAGACKYPRDTCCASFILILIQSTFVWKSIPSGRPADETDQYFVSRQAKPGRGDHHGATTSNGMSRHCSAFFNEKSFARRWWMKLLPRTTVQIAVPDEFLSRHRDWIESLKTRRWLNRNYFGRVTIFWPRRNIHRERLERNVYRQKGKIGEHLKLETQVWFACGAGNGKTSFSCWKTEGGRWKHSSKEIVLSWILTKLCESRIF